MEIKLYFTIYLVVKKKTVIRGEKSSEIGDELLIFDAHFL
jgi:hypothetical protein